MGNIQESVEDLLLSYALLICNESRARLINTRFRLIADSKKTISANKNVPL